MTKDGNQEGGTTAELERTADLPVEKRLEVIIENAHQLHQVLADARQAFHKLSSQDKIAAMGCTTELLNAGSYGPSSYSVKDGERVVRGSGTMADAANYAERKFARAEEGLLNLVKSTINLRLDRAGLSAANQGEVQATTTHLDMLTQVFQKARSTDTITPRNRDEKRQYLANEKFIARFTDALDQVKATEAVLEHDAGLLDRQSELTSRKALAARRSEQTGEVQEALEKSHQAALESSISYADRMQARAEAARTYGVQVRKQQAERTGGPAI